ncbi:hypothetical protein J6590_032074 [Homalodisca vitripennis]|nr:hypothetical protein J6590_032074 [Homalodisca vitripennis]
MQQQELDVLMTNYSKAFDCLDHNIISKKLTSQGIRDITYICDQNTSCVMYADDTTVLIKNDSAEGVTQNKMNRHPGGSKNSLLCFGGNSSEIWTCCLEWILCRKSQQSTPPAEKSYPNPNRTPNTNKAVDKHLKP